ncbi:MAG: hypothetical protein QOE11_1853, partial [Solirubrobacteraceae bacterium]|nr:hypothetical protein [Solirubrobacteraceae bacterium]
GIGKTRLAYELGLQAHRSGAIVLQGSCEEEALAPYEPFAEALGHWAREVPPSELAARLREAGPGLTALLPWLAEEPQSPATTGGAAMRYASFEAVASLLSSMHAQGGVVLVIDDLHWADASSAALLRHVLCARPEASVLVVATYRHDEAAARAPVAEMLARLHQDGLLERLPLTGLGRGEVDELVREVTGDVPSAGLTAAVHAETEGNPFFVAEIARRLGEGAAAHRLELPESVRELIERRLAGLGEPCLRLLAVAAVIGREFELAPLEHASDLEPQALEEALEEAVRAGLVVELPGLEDRLAFTHTLIRRTIADGLTRSRRRRIHACVAEALERVSGGEDAETWITYHLCEAGPAGDPDRAVAYALRAAERATQKLAYAEAVELYTRALVLLPREDPRRRKMALKRALAFTALGHLYAGDAGRPGAAGPGDGALSLRP